MKWFRLYDELVDDPKMILLPAEVFRNVIFLWCVASQNDGYLPPVEAVAVKLRLPVAKTRKLLADLKSRGLLDEHEGRLHPHNWNGRQFKSDGPSTPRVKRFRGGKKPDPGNGDETFHETGKKRPETFHETTMKRPQSQRQNQKQNQRSEQHTSENETARAAGSKCAIRPAAFALAEELWQTAGFTKENLPPGWCGSPMAIDKWLEEDCPAEVIRFAVESVLKRKIPENFAYFNPVIATALANHKRPLPQVSIPESQPIEVRNGRPYRPQSFTEIALDRLQAIRSDSEEETGTDRAGSGGPAIELDPVSE